MAIVN